MRSIACFLQLTIATARILSRSGRYGTVYDAVLGDKVLDVPDFPAPAHAAQMGKVRKDLNDGPVCVPDHGLAHVKSTQENIQHLVDVVETTCRVRPNRCARVSNLDNSSVFACNYQLGDVFTLCGQLVEPTKRLSKECRLQDFYDYGYIELLVDSLQSEDDTVPLTVALGGEHP